MKKLLLLALVILGGVEQMSSENITRRVWAFCNWGGSWQSTDHSIRIHYFKSDGTDITSWNASETQYMTRFNNTNWFYYDITADESALASVKVIIRANSGDNQTVKYDDNRDVMDLVNNCYKLIVEYVDGENRATVSELKYYLLNSSTKDRAEMTTTDCLTFEKTIDNQSSPGENYYVVAPSFAFSSDFSEIYWGLVFRPWQEHQALTFENVSDRTFFAEDGNGNSWNTNNVAANFKLSLNTLTWKYSIDSYFTRSITSAGIATFSSQYDVAVPQEVTASYVTGVGTNNVLTTAPITNGIPAGTGVLLEGSAGTYTFTPATSTDNVSGNKLVAVSSDGTVSQTEGGNTNYVLTTNGDDSAPARFYKVNSAGNDITAGKAYLQLPTPTTSAREFFSIWDETNSINAVAQEQQFDGKAYNLAGQRVAQPTKGLYIVNGKKVIKK